MHRILPIKLSISAKFTLNSCMKNNEMLRSDPGDSGRSNLPNFTENDLLLRGGVKKGSNGRANSIHMMDGADVSGEKKKYDKKD